MSGLKLAFTRYVWCDDCGHYEACDLRSTHERAMRACVKCGSRDVCSAPPEHHQKRLLKAALNKIGPSP